MPLEPLEEADDVGQHIRHQAYAAAMSRYNTMLKIKEGTNLQIQESCLRVPPPIDEFSPQLDDFRSNRCGAGRIITVERDGIPAQTSRRRRSLGCTPNSQAFITGTGSESGSNLG